jgi:hypothetical protein
MHGTQARVPPAPENDHGAQQILEQQIGQLDQELATLLCSVRLRPSCRWPRSTAADLGYTSGGLSFRLWPGVHMKKLLTFFAALLLSTAVVSAGPKPQPGTILSQTSVPCGTKKSKKQDIDLLCQQYVVRSATTDYTVRQAKPSDQTLIPLNTAIQFTLDKNKIKFKVDGKSHEFLVVSQAASSSADPNRQ